MTVRWRFYDPATAETYTFGQNPKAMSGGYPQRSIMAAIGLDGVARVLNVRSPVDWEFSGNLRTQAQYDAFVSWSRRLRPIIVCDHFLTLRICIPVSFAPQDVRNVKSAWLHSYVFKTRLISTDALSSVEQSWVAAATAALGL